jgi:flagellar biosynthesis protein FlhB
MARKKGDVAVSRELAGVLATLAGGICLVLCGGSFVSRLSELARSCFSSADPNQFTAAIWLVIGFVARIGGAAALTALLVMGIQVGFRFRLKVRFSKLNPLKGIARMFSRQRLLDLLLMFIKMVVLTSIGFWIGTRMVCRIITSDPVELEQLVAAAGKIILIVHIGLASVVVTMGFLDFFLQRSRYRKRMRMTRKEVRDEHKEEDGDPQIKSERKRFHRQILQGGNLIGLANARVVVVNPTQLAVALGYDAEQDQAPWVVTSGKGSLAAKIRNEANRLGIPIVQHVPLARALINVEAGNEIPEQLYKAVAEVIQTIQNLGYQRVSDNSKPSLGQRR